MKQVRTPRLASNLYRDLRDRRMLIPAVALIVALVAVPVLLKKSASSAPAPPAPVADAGAPSAAQPAVVTREVGVTDYRRRLDRLQSKDPFRRHFMSLPKSSKLSTTTPSSSSSSSSTSDTTAGGTTGLGAPARTSPSGATGASVPPSAGSSGGSGGTSTKPTTRSRRLYAFRISVAIGRPGHLTHRSNVKRLTLLPSPDKPIVAFLGVTSDGTRALFSISGDVSAVRGDGRCFPKRATCRYLALKAGDEAKLSYAPEGDRTYKLKLIDAHLAPVHGTAGNRAGKRSSRPVLAPDG
jgi:hypothetical protein